MRLSVMITRRKMRMMSTGSISLQKWESSKTRFWSKSWKARSRTLFWRLTWVCSTNQQIP